MTKTGIGGFDSISDGGIKKSRSIVLCGNPGTGKTTFGIQFIYLGIEHFDEEGVYVSLSHNLEEIKDDVKSFGWDLQEKIRQDKLLMIDARPFAIKDNEICKDDSLYRGEDIPFEHLTKLIISSIKRIHAKRVVIDSTSILAMQYENKFLMRQGFQAMMQTLENNGVTSILISENPNKDEIPLEWFAGSGIVQLTNKQMGDTIERTIQILKLRGADHSNKTHPIKINSDGISISHPRLKG